MLNNEHNRENIDLESLGEEIKEATCLELGVHASRLLEEYRRITGDHSGSSYAVKPYSESFEYVFSRLRAEFSRILYEEYGIPNKIEKIDEDLWVVLEERQDYLKHTYNSILFFSLSPVKMSVVNISKDPNGEEILFVNYKGDTISFYNRYGFYSKAVREIEGRRNIDSMFSRINRILKNSGSNKTLRFVYFP